MFAVLQELRNAHSEEVMGIRREEEMEMSDDDDESPCKKMRLDDSGGRRLSQTASWLVT